MMNRIFTMGLVLCLVGCGGSSAPAVGEQRQALDRAVASYLEDHDMDLKIDAYKTFSISEDGQTARAEIAMGYAGGMIKATARFNFDFEKQDGRWLVTNCSQK